MPLDWMAQIPDALHGVYGDALLRGQQARQRADDLWGQMQQNIAAPTPEIDPQRAFIGTLLGGLSQALSPQMGGQQLAQETIASKNNDLRQRKSTALAALHERYTEAAQQAESAGDTERAIKMRAAELKIIKQKEDLERTHQVSEDKLKRQHERDLVGLQGSNSLAVAQVHAAATVAAAAQREAGRTADGALTVGAYQQQWGQYTRELAHGKRIQDGKEIKVSKADVHQGMAQLLPERLASEPLDANGLGLSRYLTRQLHNRFASGLKTNEGLFDGPAAPVPLNDDAMVLRNSITQFYAGEPDDQDLVQLTAKWRGANGAPSAILGLMADYYGPPPTTGVWNIPDFIYTYLERAALVPKRTK